MILTIGIDQSINSTGMTVQVWNDNNSELPVQEHFYIIKGNDKKLTAKEQKAQEYVNFDYVIYNKIKTTDLTDSHEIELAKTNNLINITNCICKLIRLWEVSFNPDEIYLCMEGISYQSANTRSIAELSGLNYLLRYRILKNFPEIHLIVSPPSEIKKFATGNGAAKKEAMISLFNNIYPNLYLIPKIDDLADSYWMCSYCKTLYTN